MPKRRDFVSRRVSVQYDCIILAMRHEIYRAQMPNITPHVCRHTYCSNQAKAGMNPKTLQYLMGHSDIGVTLNTYTHLGLEDAAEELRRMEEAEAARREQEKLAGKAQDSQKLFKAISPQNLQGTLRAAECRFFIVEKSVVMVYNKLLNFAGVTGRSRRAEICGGKRDYCNR